MEIKFNSFEENTLSAYVFFPEKTSCLSGSEFCKQNINTVGQQREENILKEFLCGNIPNFLKSFKPVTVSNNGNTIVYMVSPDYMSIGNDEDYVRFPVNAITAQKIADRYDCSLPTSKMVNDIWLNAENKLQPLPKGAPFDHSMLSTKQFEIHNGKIQNQLINLDYSALTAGSKKDIVLTNKLYPNNPNKRISIFGWHQLDGTPIQGLNPVSHEVFYSDYSQGLRLISKDVLVNDIIMKLEDVFKNPNLCNLVSNEGPLKFLRY
jgi:hypothetical protein